MQHYLRKNWSDNRRGISFEHRDIWRLFLVTSMASFWRCLLFYCHIQYWSFNSLAYIHQIDEKCKARASCQNFISSFELTTVLLMCWQWLHWRWMRFWKELYLADNKLMPSDGIQLGSLLKYNRMLSVARSQEQPPPGLLTFPGLLVRKQWFRHATVYRNQT